MRKLLILGTVLFLALAVTVFADEVAKENAFRAYEAVVAETESVARLPAVTTYFFTINDYNVLDQRAATADQRIVSILSEKDVSIRDVKRLTQLNNRFNEANLIIAGRLGERGYALYDGW